MDPGEVLLGMLFFVSISAVFILRGPLGRAWADRIAGRRLDRDDTGGVEVRELADRVQGELDDLRERLNELEERQDFSERMLAQQRDRGKLGAES